MAAGRVNAYVYAYAYLYPYLYITENPVDTPYIVYITSCIL